LARRAAAAFSAALVLSGCAPDERLVWEGWDLPAWELPAIPEPTPTPAPQRGDFSGDRHLATARFAFILMAVGGLAGVVALQSKIQRDQGKAKDPDTKQEDIGFPIAAFGLGVGLPIYIYSFVTAQQDLDRAERDRLKASP